MAMKNLVIAGLLWTGLVQLGTGCIIVGDDEPPPPPPPPPTEGVFSVAWTLLGDVTDDGEVNLVDVECDSPTDLLQVVSDPTPGADGDEIVDKFNCGDGVHDTAPLPADVYDVWVELRDPNDETILLAESDVQVGVALGGGDIVDLDFEFPIDHGVFTLRWTVEENGAPSSCGNVGATEVSLLSTLVGDAGTSFDDLFTCEDSGGESGFTPLGTYTLVTTLLDGGADPGPEDDIPLAMSQAREVTLDYGNEIEDLGSFVFDIVD